MAANPLTFQEIDAFCRLAHVRMSAWQVELITRLDAAVLRVWADKNPKAPTKPSDPPELIPTSNVPGLKALFRGLATRKKGGQGD